MSCLGLLDLITLTGVITIPVVVIGVSIDLGDDVEIFGTSTLGDFQNDIDVV